MPFIGSPWEAAQMPPLPPQRMKRLDVALMIHHETYNALHATLLSEGFTFSDLILTGLGSDDKLEDNGTWGEGAPPVDVDHFARDWHPEDWLPHKDFTLPFWEAALTLQSCDFRFNFDDITTWPDAMATLPFILNDQDQYKYGVGSRAMLRFFQLKIAMGIRNIMCLDFRGRPPE